MKILKRNAVMVVILLFVSVAVYLNWSYNQGIKEENGSGATDVVSESSGDEIVVIGKDASAGLYYMGAETNASAMEESEISEYFAGVRLNRQQARYDATESLTAVSETESASQEMIDNALNKIVQLAEWTVLESELEGLIIAKGFQECVVYISDERVSVTVPAPLEGLSTAAVARITETVIGKTDFTAAELSIIEIK